MSKVNLFILIISLSVGLYLTYYLASFITAFVPYYLHTSLATFYGSKNTNTQIINYLDQLIETPGIGSLFYEEKILELVKLKQWDHVIEASLLAISTNINKNSFNIWYHKALAQCLSYRIDDCRDSSNVVEYLAQGLYQDLYVRDLKKYLNMIKASTGVQKGQTIPINQAFQNFKIEQNDYEIQNNKNSQNDINFLKNL